MRARPSMFGAVMLSGFGLAASFLLPGFRSPGFVDPEPIRAESPLAEEGGPDGFVLEESRIRGALGLSPAPAIAPANSGERLKRASLVLPLDNAEVGDSVRKEGSANPEETSGPGSRGEMFRVVGSYEEAGELRYFLKGRVSGRFIPVAADSPPEALADFAIALAEGHGFSLLLEEEP